MGEGAKISLIKLETTFLVIFGVLCIMSKLTNGITGSRYRATGICGVFFDLSLEDGRESLIMVLLWKILFCSF